MIPKITNMMVAITNQCNMRCPFCFIEKDEKVMKYETIVDVIDFLHKNSLETKTTPRIVFFGGEPMTEWDSLIVPSVDYIRGEYGKNFDVSITTNISLITPERLAYMKRNRFSCLYSVDGGKETMTINRPFIGGSSSFEVVDKKIDQVIDVFPNAACRMTLYAPTSMNFFEDIMYVTEKGFKKINALPNIFEEWSDDCIENLRGQIKLYGDYIVSEFRDGRIPTIWEHYKECFFQIVKVNDCKKTGEFQGMSKCKSCGKCGFGLGQHATCDYTGDIYGCLHPAPLTRDNIFYLGNIYDGVDENRTIALQELCDSIPLGGLDCPNCNLESICDRGCAPNNVVITGHMNTPPKMYCHFQRMVFDDSIRVANILGEEKNESFRDFFHDCVNRRKR